jgi:hypothetical protein
VNSLPRPAPPDLATALLVVLFAWTAARFAWQPGLASLADDSVSYLVMAQVFSPWQAASAPVAEAFAREAFYPPLFPLVLAVFGASHDIARAHAVTALLLACWLPLFYALAARWLGGRWAALAATLALASLPALWIQAKAVLSEPLFGLLLLALFLVLEREGDDRGRRSLTAVLLAALVLTRSAALVAVAGYGLWAFARPGRDLRQRAIAALPAAAALAAYGAWVALRPAATSDDYLRIVAERSASILQAASVLAALGASAARQAVSMTEAWTGSLLIFWVEGSPVRPLLAGAVGALALAGLGLRFVAWKADAWMSAAYLATFLAWPFYDQMTRFLLPLVPVLLLYAFWALGEGARRLRRAPAGAQGVLALVVLSLTLPGLAFLQGRAKAEGGLAEIVDWYRTPDLDEARRRARVHLDLMADMEEIRRATGPQDRVMWVTPSYLALLAGRRGVAAPAAELGPDRYRLAVEQAAPDYVFLSVFHPRDTLRDAAWQAGRAALLGRAEVVHTRLNGEDGKVSSLLMKMPARRGSP